MFHGGDGHAAPMAARARRFPVAQVSLSLSGSTPGGPQRPPPAWATDQELSRLVAHQTEEIAALAFRRPRDAASHGNLLEQGFAE